MKILHVIDQISQKTAGGSAKVCYQLAREQAKQGHDVTIWSADEEESCVVKIKPHRALVWLGMRITPQMGYTDRFDIVHCHNLRTFQNWWVIPPYKETPYVLSAYGSASKWSRRGNMIDRIVFQPVLHHASKLIAMTDFEVEQYVALGAEKERCAIIPPGIDMSEFANLPERTNKGQKTILSLGRIHPIKGIDILVDAFAMLPMKDVRLVIAGNVEDSYYFQQLRDQVVRLAITDRVDFVGPLYGRDKVQAYVNADVYVQPSRYEAWGLTWMEALACGTPVILSENCQSAKILPEFAGYVARQCVAGGCYSVKERISHAIQGMFLFKKMDHDRQDRIDFVSPFDWPVVAKRIEDVYKEVIAHG